VSYVTLIGKMKREFEVIRHALEEHLTGINENTSEIQALFDYLHELEIKIDKVTSRIDGMQINNDVDKVNLEPLNHLEKKIFLVFYTEDLPLSYEEISARGRVPITIVPESVSSLIHKGIPLLRSFVNNRMFFRLSPSFKEAQAKENLVNLSLQSFMGE